jgi:hypothetical protein
MKADLNYQLFMIGQLGFQQIATKTDFQRPVLARKSTENMYMGLKNKKELV